MENIKVIKRHKQILTILIIILCLILFFIYQNNALQLTRLNIKSNIENSIKIIQISDLHGKQFGKKNSIFLAKLDKLSPDIVVFTGDLIDQNAKNIDISVGFLGKISESYPTFFVLGNHEYRSNHAEEIVAKLVKAGVVVLRNEIQTINLKGVTINILGLDEPKNNSKSSVLFQNLNDKNGLKLVLSHYPENYALLGDKSYNQYTFDLMMAGHAHGGQFRLPFIGGVYAPGQGINPKYYAGLYAEKENNKLVVSRGLGNSLFPLRLFNRPEIVEIIFQSN